MKVKGKVSGKLLVLPHFQHTQRDFREISGIRAQETKYLSLQVMFQNHASNDDSCCFEFMVWETKSWFGAFR